MISFISGLLIGGAFAIFIYAMILASDEDGKEE